MAPALTVMTKDFGSRQATKQGLDPLHLGGEAAVETDHQHRQGQTRGSALLQRRLDGRELCQGQAQGLLHEAVPPAAMASSTKPAWVSWRVATTTVSTPDPAKNEPASVVASAKPCLRPWCTAETPALEATETSEAPRPP